MSTIITITFSPSIDKSASVATIQADKKMRCSQPNTEPGGGGINVARVINRLGGDVKAIFPSGGYTGMFFNYLLENEKVPFTSIQTKNETRENFVIFDESTNKQFRFGMPSNEIFEDEFKNLIKVIENHESIDFIIASGSLPPGTPTDIYSQLSKIAKSKNAKFIADTSGEGLKSIIKEDVYLLKPNLEELEILLDIKKIEPENIEVLAKELIRKKSCEIIVISLGANGAMLVTKDKTITIKPPKVNVNFSLRKLLEVYIRNYI